MPRAWLALLVLGMSARANAQAAPTIVAAFDTAHWLTPESDVAFTLSRPLHNGDGRLVVFIGDLDVSALLEHVGERVVYRARPVALASGEHEVIVYLERRADEWSELGRWPLRVLQRGGFEKADLVPHLAFNNKGQIAAGQEPVTEPIQRAAFQDFSANFGLQTVVERSGWAVRTQSNYIGVSRREEALRFAQKGTAAPRIDLSDYLITFERGPLALRLGDIAFGTHRYLISGLQHRGAATDLALARFAHISLAGLSGSRKVGWSDLLGIQRTQHRILSGNVALELFPSRPGLAHVDAGVVDGSVLPEAGFTQGAVNDRETSRGAALRLMMHDPAQRVRLEAGYTRSRFANPADPLLAQGSEIVRVRPETSSAQYIDVNLNVLRNVAIADALPVNVVVVGRHERVDPMYRTVAMPGIRADLLQNTVELTGTVGTASLQVSHTRNRDNLDEIPTILSTRTRTSQATIALPVASLLGKAVPDWMPILSGGLSWQHQFGLGTPQGSEAFPAFIPDQLSRTQMLSLLSQAQTWRVQLQLNRSEQDNRQEQRQLADFVSVTRALSIAITPKPAFTLTIDLANDVANAAERAEETDTRRAGGSIAWRPGPWLALDAGLLHARTTDTSRTFESTITDARFELSSTVPLLRISRNGQSAQLFFRYNRQLSSRTVGAVPEVTVRNWTMNTGLTLSLF